MLLSSLVVLSTTLFTLAASENGPSDEELQLVLDIPYANVSGNSPLVEISNGNVEGVSNDGLELFLGIPYAKPPYVFPSIDVLFLLRY